MTILNVTQHVATNSQIAVGVVDMLTIDRVELTALLTFTTVPSYRDMVERATAIKAIVDGYSVSSVMLGGAPFFMAILETVLHYTYSVVYAFSTRESIESVLADGSVRKVNVFNHAGWVQGTINKAEEA